MRVVSHHYRRLSQASRAHAMSVFRPPLMLSVRHVDWVGVQNRRLTPEEMAGFLSFGGDQPDRKHAAFRLVGDDLDPDAVTRATGVAPTTSHRLGEPTRLERGPAVWRTGVWILDSKGAIPDQGNHMEQHLVWLLAQLAPRAVEIRDVAAAQGLRADVSCGYFMGQANSSLPRELRPIVEPQQDS